MFGRVRVPGSPPYTALLIPDAAIGTEQSRKFVLVVDDGSVGAAEIRRPSASMTDGLRVIKSGLAADDRVIVNGLMRARARPEGHAAGAGRAAGRVVVSADVSKEASKGAAPTKAD